MYSAVKKRIQNKISLITSSKKRKDLRVSSEDAVLAVMRKHVTKKKLKAFYFDRVDFFVFLVLKRSIILCNK
jgi:hypothetical protein